jgi:replicative DNA helicase
MSQSLYSVEAERAVIAGLIQYPEIYVQIQPYLTANDFSRTHSSLWTVISHEIENKGTPNPIVLANRLNNLGIKLAGIECLDYLESLKFTSIDRDHITDVAKEVKKLSIIRTVYNNAEDLKRKVIEIKDGPAGKILEAVDDALANSRLMFDSDEDEAVNLYDGLCDFVEDKGNAPMEEVGYKMPFKLWNQYYGGLRRGGLYFTASRSGQGKSTFLSYIADQVANVVNPELNIKVLFLDTEMDEDDQKTRLAAVRTGCPFYLIDTGQWRKSEEWFPKMRIALDKIRLENRNFYFKQVSSMGIDSLVNFVRRWYFKNVGRGGNALIIYDYLKVLSNDGEKGQPEWAVALQKMQRLKDLAVEIDAPIFTALQVNRSGTTTNKSSSEVVDDETVLSISGRIDWLVNFAGILRRKTPDEIQDDGQDFGTHKLIPLKTRFQGRSSSGHQDLIKIYDKGKARYKQNYLCFDLENFNVEERGDYRNIAELKGLTKIKKNDNSDSGGL